jgi:hypothetical protein
LSTIPFSPLNPAPIDNFAHLRTTSIISDTANWVRVSGSIVADSTYGYLMLGNFYDDASTDTTTLNCANCINLYSYYLFDDICVSTDSLLCNGGIDALPCTVSVPEITKDNSFSVFPNPTSDLFTIRSIFHEPFTVSIFNSLAQCVYNKSNVLSGEIQLDFSPYINGMYHIHITTTNSQFNYTLLKQ